MQGPAAEVTGAATASDRILRAAAILRSVEEDANCAWCAKHVHDVRLVVEDLARVSALGDDVRARAELARAAVFLGEVAERTGVLADIGRAVRLLRRVFRL